MEKFGGYKTEVKERINGRERRALKNKVEWEEQFRGIREVARRDGKENVCTRPNRQRENKEAATSCKGTWTCHKEKTVHQQSEGGGKRCTDVPLWQSKRE